MGSAGRKAWIVATSMGAVEASKDQLGFCRWNYALRLLQQYAKTNLIVINIPPHNLSTPPPPPSTCSTSSNALERRDKVKKTEDSLNRVMHLSCWGPSSVRF